MPENFLPANDATAKNLDNQLIALAKNDPESEHGSEEQAWVEEPKSILFAGVDCNSGALENFPDQIFEAPGISRRRLLAPRSPQRRIPNFCSSQPKSSSPGIQNSESSPSDMPYRDPVNIEWADLQPLMTVGLDGEPNREVCNYEFTQIPIYTLFEEIEEPIFIAQVVTPARLCRFYLLFLPLSPYVDL